MRSVSGLSGSYEVKLVHQPMVNRVSGRVTLAPTASESSAVAG